MPRASKPVTVTLGDLQDRVSARVKSGAYASTSEVLRAAVRALDREDAAIDDWLRQKVAQSLDDPRPNLARYVFLDRRAHDAFPAWRVAADEQVGRLRRAMARWDGDDAVADLVAELRQEPEFEVRWAAHPVDEKRRGAKLITHPVAGDLDLTVEVLAIADDSEQVLVTWLPADDVTAARLDAVVAPPHLRVVGRG